MFFPGWKMGDPIRIRIVSQVEDHDIFGIQIFSRERMLPMMLQAHILPPIRPGGGDPMPLDYPL